MPTLTRVKFHYPTYMFRVTEQDPIVDLVMSKLKAHDIPLARAAEGSGVTVTTLYNWDKGRTKRPQFATIAAVLGFAGYELVAAPRRKAANGLAHPPAVLRRFPTARSLERVKPIKEAK